MIKTELENQLNLQFHNPSLLLQALTHRSFANEQGEKEPDNERLEFLGDALLNYLAGELLYKRFVDAHEGYLTRLRSALVRTESLAGIARQLALGTSLRMGRGEERNGGRERLTNLCSAFEALVAAIYLDQGLETLRLVVLPLLQNRLDYVIATGDFQDARTLLQEWSQSEKGFTPTYQLISEEGPDHDKQFLFEVHINDMTIAQGTGNSKRAAAQAAARNAIRVLEDELNTSITQWLAQTTPLEDSQKPDDDLKQD
ncbi:MAG: ribonuclease III [Phototrophicaceae bacterium]